MDPVGESGFLVAAARPLRSRSRLSPVTNADNTGQERRPHQTHRLDPTPPRHRGPRPPSRAHWPHQVARSGGGGEAPHRFSHVSPARRPHPTPDLGDISCPLTCGQKELQHHRRQQLHGPEAGGDGEAVITLNAAAAGRLHRGQAAEGSEIPPGKVCCPFLGAIPPRSSAAAVRLSVRSRSVRPPSPCASVRPTSSVWHAAPRAD